MATTTKTEVGAEQRRLAERDSGEQPWDLWGAHLSERQWGTVREDYSAKGKAWDYFPHEHARSRAYRWGEDGLAGFSDRQQRLCLSLALWNGRDPILKERLFGLGNEEGNHGEDVKELYYYLDATPTHAYLKHLYKYPQAAFPYARLRDENLHRDRTVPEFELMDTGVFDGDRYFDVLTEYAKAGPRDILMRITVHNRAPEAAAVHVLPQLWFRNTWAWSGASERPRISAIAPGTARAHHGQLKDYTWHAEGAPPLLFCDNDTNPRLYPGAVAHGYFKDGFHDHVVGGRADAVNTQDFGTKAAAHYVLENA